MGRNVLMSSLKNASFSIAFQIVCRCVTFIINAFILRRVDPNVLGIMNVRLLLLESMLLFFSREALSRSALSSTTQHKNKCTWPQLMNHIWTSVPLSMIFSIPMLIIWMHVLLPVDSMYRQQYDFSCFAVALACTIELIAEAPVFVSQVFCFVKLKAIIDTLHIFIRTIIFITLIMYNKNITIYAFGFAQIASALTIVIGHYGFFYKYMRNLRKYRNRNKGIVPKNDMYENMEDFPFNGIHEMLPLILRERRNPSSLMSPLTMFTFTKNAFQFVISSRISSDNQHFNAELHDLFRSFFKQGIVKWALTEGEKIVMSISPVLTFSEQATYDVVNNMGSLAARFIFRPIEDSSYFYFTQTIARDVALKEQTKEKVDEASQVLANVCRIVFTIGLIGFTMGQSYAGTILLFYGGPDFVASGLPVNLLRWHSLAIILLALNGICEGYMFATNTSKDINNTNYIMTAFSVAFLVLSYILTTMLGPVGFILANCVNMILRITYSSRFIKKQYAELHMNPLLKIFPGKLFMITIIVVGVSCKLSEIYILPTSIIHHLLIGASGTSVLLICWFIDNKELILIGLNRFRNRVKSE